LNKPIPKFKIEKLTIADGVGVTEFLANAVAGFHPSVGWYEWLAKASEIAGIEAMLGWKLVTEEGMEGVHLATPFKLAQSRGLMEHELVSHNFYVTEAWRGLPGLGLFRAFLAEKKRFHLTATTANAQSSALWKALGGRPIPESSSEVYQMKLSAGFIEEAVARKFPKLQKHMHWPVATLAKLKLDGALRRAAPRDVQVVSAQKLAHTAELIRWWLENPLSRVELVELLMADGTCYALVELAGRGHRGQIKTALVRGLWGTAWAKSPAATARTVSRALLKSAALVSFAFSEAAALGGETLRSRLLDAPRRWWSPLSKEESAEAMWNGLDAV
jgi:hypothetical protein